MCEHCGCGQPPDNHGAGVRTISVEEDLLAHDRAHAEALRARLAALDARLVNVIGSPGCGKTALLTRLIPLLDPAHTCAVVEGDLATDNDAARIRTTGAPVRQIQTGTACHLTAHDVQHAVEELPIAERGLVLVENVGNLVCPSMFDLGESLRIVCLSTTEGTDKPQKYPVAFREAGLVVITKQDLAPYVDFDLDACRQLIEDVRPGTPTIVTSATDGAGIEELAERIAGLW
jgi:hydrogenase nickel incorporation protein HypB